MTTPAGPASQALGPAALIPTSALVLCPTTQTYDEPILGLGVGERLLLALTHAGIRRIGFAGAGARPECDRADFEEVAPETLANEPMVLVVSADTVFDRGLVKALIVPPELPVRRVTGEEVPRLLRYIADTMADWPMGQADSGVGYALRIRDQQAARRAHRALLLSLRKPVDGWISRNLNRHVSTFVTQYLVLTGISPNVFTVAFMGLGLVAALLAALGGPWWVLVLAGLGFQAQSILDGCDGEIARLTYQFSKKGQWLDSIGDDVTNYAFCLGLAVGQAKVHGADWILWLGLITLACQCTATGVLYRRLMQLGTGDLLAIPDLMTTNGGQQGPVGRFIRTLSKRDVFVFIIATLTVLQLPLVAFLVYSAGTFPTVVGVILNDRKFGQQLAAEGQTAS